MIFLNDDALEYISKDEKSEALMIGEMELLHEKEMRLRELEHEREKIEFEKEQERKRLEQEREKLEFEKDQEIKRREQEREKLAFEKEQERKKESVKKSSNLLSWK